jgi:hypothetical protein
LIGQHRASPPNNRTTKGPLKNVTGWPPVEDTLREEHLPALLLRRVGILNAGSQYLITEISEILRFGDSSNILSFQQTKIITDYRCI